MTERSTSNGESTGRQIDHQDEIGEMRFLPNTQMILEFRIRVGTSRLDLIGLSKPR